MDALLLAVLNALWQGAALIALVALALRFGLRRNATTACVVWSITFLVVAVLPALDLALARPATLPVTELVRDRAKTAGTADARMTTAARSAALRTSPAPAAAARIATDSPQRANGSIALVRTAIAERAQAIVMRLGGAATAFARAWGVALLSAWALVAGALLLRLGRGYAAISRMKRDATPLDDPLVLARLHAAGHRRRATVARSALVDVPCAVGFRRPMILVPTRLAASLDVDDLARVVLHESAHLQRYDDWLNALEHIVCALQFFQPALYAARRGIDFEREVACDDRVLEDAGEPLRYAECLARIVQCGVRGPRVAIAPGFMLRRPQVIGRVRRIVDRSRDASPQLRFAAVALTAVVLAATLGIARLQVPVVSAAAAATPATRPAAVRGGGDLLDALSDAKYARPSVDELIALSNQGVDADYVRRMNALVHPRPTLHELLALAVQGVTPDYAAALGRRLANEPSPAQIIAARVQGVSVAWLDGLAGLGYSKLSAGDAVALAVQGTSVAYVRGLLDAGLRNITLGQLVALRVQGVDASYVHRLAAHGIKNISIDELLRLKVTGFEP
ncbi:MAG TPA: M56 family metallopeptidase [Candidatus Elarobacter sp.]|jgi:beta-lactamase regulating signal transducer with metallopeptidase domain